jgi:hypothetical protein
VIPRPRAAADDTIPAGTEFPRNAEPAYNRPQEHKPGWTFTTRVEYADGAEGERLRTELTGVIRELLEWAAEQPEQERKAA